MLLIDCKTGSGFGGARRGGCCCCYYSACAAAIKFFIISGENITSFVTGGGSGPYSSVRWSDSLIWNLEERLKISTDGERSFSAIFYTLIKIANTHGLLREKGVAVGALCSNILFNTSSAIAAKASG